MTSIYKLTGAGNNFLFIDLREASARKNFENMLRRQFKFILGKRIGAAKSVRAKVARHLCNRFESIGADGLLFLEHSRHADLKWDFYNSDGSQADMCGNAARCVGAYLARVDKYFKNPIRLETKAGEILITVLPQTKSDGSHLVCVEMPKVSVAGHVRNKIKFDYIDSGVPHAVVDMTHKFKNLEAFKKNVDKLEDIVHKIRALTQFKQTGTNVTFFVRRKSKLIESLTFERGVDGYTQACGTGAVAAAYSYSKGIYNFVTVRIPGGTLAVDFSGLRPLLVGPAKFVAEVLL